MTYEEAYIEGYQAAKAGALLTDNPYQPSNHERDTTYSDELHYHWYAGYEQFHEERWSGSVCGHCGKVEVKDRQIGPHAESCPYK